MAEKSGLDPGLDRNACSDSVLQQLRSKLKVAGSKGALLPAGKKFIPYRNVLAAQRMLSSLQKSVDILILLAFLFRVKSAI